MSEMACQVTEYLIMGMYSPGDILDNAHDASLLVGKPCHQVIDEL